MKRVLHSIDRAEVTFDDPTLVADAGLIVPATLMVRLGLEALIDSTVRSWSAPATSITPIGCAPAPRRRSCPSG